MVDDTNPVPDSEGGTEKEQPSQTERVAATTKQQMILDAVRSHYIAKRSAAFANLNNYFLNGVGVSEHPDIVEECRLLFEAIDHAEGMLSSIRRIMG